MTKKIVLNCISVVVGLVCGMVFMMALHFASMLIYPAPESVDLMNQEPENLENLNAWLASLPAGAFILAVASHGLGSMSGAVVATLISGRNSLIPAVVIGILFTIAGLMNLQSIPHPNWFPYVDIPIYLVLAITAGMLLVRRATRADHSNLQTS